MIAESNLGRIPFDRSVRSDQSALKWNYARALRTGTGQNGPAHESEPLSFLAPVGQSAEIWRVVAGKIVRAPWTFPFKLSRTSYFRPPARPEKWKTTEVLARGINHC